MIKDEESTKKILDYLAKENEWVATNQIAKDTGLHFYKVELLLNEFFNSIDNTGNLERDIKPNSKYWRYKHGI